MNENDARTTHGPYYTAAQAEYDAEPIYRDARRDRTPGNLGRINEGLLLAGLQEAGVQLGAQDRRIVAWIAGWESSTVLVVLGWIERARRAGRDGGE